MSLKIINFNNSKIERSANPPKTRKLPTTRPKTDLDTILNNIGSPEPTELKPTENKKVLFNDIVEIAQYEKPSVSPLKSRKLTVVDLLNNPEKPNKSPSPRKKHKDLNDYFKKEIETLDTKLGRRTRSPSPVRCSSPVKNYYKTNFDRKKSPERISSKKIVKVKLDRNWFKTRDFLIKTNEPIEKLELKSKIKKMDLEDVLIFKYVLDYQI